MSLPEIGSVIERKNPKTARWEPFYIFLGSKKPYIFVFTRSGEVMQMTQSHYEAQMNMKVFRIMEEHRE